MVAELRAAKSTKDQVSALRAYRDRVKLLYIEVAVLQNAGARGGEAEAYWPTKYYLLEAEYLLGQAKNNEP